MAIGLDNKSLLELFTRDLCNVFLAKSEADVLINGVLTKRKACTSTLVVRGIDKRARAKADDQPEGFLKSPNKVGRLEHLNQSANQLYVQFKAAD